MAEAAAKSESKSESMEDILQSIKRIIEDDAAGDVPPAPGPSADVLELTQVVKEDGSISALDPLPRQGLAGPGAPVQDVVQSIDTLLSGRAEERTAVAQTRPEPVVQASPPPPQTARSEPMPRPSPPAQKPPMMEDGLVSDQAAHAAAAALKPIVDSAQKDYSLPPIPSSHLRSGSTVEDLILEALKPMLKAWLDEHLPLIVQKIVEKEVKRIVTFHHDG